MAQKVQLLLEDDLTHQEIPEGEGVTRQFSVDGKTYELDLSADSLKTFDEALAPFIEAGRSVSGAARSRRRSQRSGGTTRSRRDPEVAKIRAWAKDNGFEVAERGRIHQDVREAYEAAQRKGSDQTPVGKSEKPETAEKAAVKEKASATPQKQEKKAA